ncbi:hypothetical protein [Streptomyces smaragdinus]|nr:hypothetical protein [Streptomyces smaragdinus]
MAESPQDDKLPDDIWAKFQDDSWARTSNAPKEPSARARMVTDRLRHEEASTPRPRKPRKPRPRYLRWQGGLRPWAIGTAALGGVVLLSWLAAQIPPHWIF